MSVTEWQQYATEKFSAIANKRANTKAFMESASESGCDAAAKGTGLALPVLSRSNFKLFLTRVFECVAVAFTLGNHTVAFTLGNHTVAFTLGQPPSIAAHNPTICSACAPCSHIASGLQPSC
jgi:hypothetical protein